MRTVLPIRKKVDKDFITIKFYFKKMDENRILFADLVNNNKRSLSNLAFINCLKKSI